jgi:hypothetical protein
VNPRCSRRVCLAFSAGFKKRIYEMDFQKFFKGFQNSYLEKYCSKNGEINFVVILMTRSIA